MLVPSLLNFQTRVHALRSTNLRIYDTSTFITISNHQKKWFDHAYH